MIGAVAGILWLSACSGGSSGAGPATKLPLGQEAVVADTMPASGSSPAENTMLGITVVAVRVGTQAELAQAGLKVEAHDKSATPYYVDARYTNKGNAAVTRHFSVGLEQTDGNSVPTLLNFAFGVVFDLCKDGNSGTLDPGQSYDGCTLLLVPKGKTVDRVRYVSQGPDAKITFTDWAVK